VELSSQGQPGSLSPFKQHQVLCLFQEALTNVAKHARAGNVNIDLTWTAEALTIQLADDGQGFEPHSLRINGHLGLLIMQERAQEINAQFTLASRPGAGSQVILRVPLNHMAPPLVLAGADGGAVYAETANC
jgi:signal transduction histidine kinase